MLKAGVVSRQTPLWNGSKWRTCVTDVDLHSSTDCYILLLTVAWPGNTTGLALPSALQPPCCSVWGSNRRGGSYPRIPTLHPNPPTPQAPRLLCSLSLTSVLFVPRFPSPDGGCTTPARVFPAWPAYGLLPANSNVYRTSEKKMSFFSRSYSALQRATRRSLFLVIVMNKVLARGNPLPYFPASPTLRWDTVL